MMHKWEKLDELGHAWRMPVPGGWLYSIEVAKFDCGSAPYPPTYGGGVVFIPDPTAPHCQPAQTPVGPPPMTDDDLIAWCTATYGEPVVDIEKVHTWDIHLDCGAVCRLVFASAASDAHRWNSGGAWLSARTAGPALWAAHHFGGAP
jgi:hypothetical protein